MITRRELTKSVIITIAGVAAFPGAGIAVLDSFTNEEPLSRLARLVAERLRERIETPFATSGTVRLDHWLSVDSYFSERELEKVQNGRSTHLTDAIGAAFADSVDRAKIEAVAFGAVGPLNHGQARYEAGGAVVRVTESRNYDRPSLYSFDIFFG